MLDNFPNVSASLRLRAKLRAKKKTYSLTEWHDEKVKEMAEAAGVPENQVARKAIEFLALNFDEEIVR